MTHDVVICGAGPAGSVVARRLAAAGLRVALVGGAVRPGWEGLSSRSHGLLTEEGADSQGNVIAGPFVRRGVWANGRSVEGVEWLVERGAVANALSARAREQGADYRADAVIGMTRADDQWRMALRGGEVLAASMVVDARGRRARSRRAQSNEVRSGEARSSQAASSPQRHESQTTELLRDGLRCSGPVLLAIGQGFRRHGGGASGTGIGVTDTGWCWWAERGDSLWVQIIGRPRSLHPTAWPAAAAAQIPALAQVLEGARAESAAVARAAHTQLGEGRRAARVQLGGEDASVARAAPTRLDAVCGNTEFEPTFWLAGDAAMALDPLSGQGIYEAVRGARLVATAIQSVWAGGDARVAQRFVAERREEAWLHGVSVAAGFYRENESCGGFWSETAAAYEALLQQRASIGAARIERRPVLDEGRILEREVVVTAEHPRGVWQVAGVSLAALQGYLQAAEHASVDAAAVALDRAPAAVASAMNWLRERGPLLQQGLPQVSSGG
jgi:2-polyprenyl-6-methoxyphenol hydroxylase-like FAD-dependent oxidoreductase